MLMNKKIIVADDDQAIGEVMRIILEERQYTVVNITDGKLIMDTALAQQPDLMFLDISLSGYDGGEITKMLKSNIKTKHIPVVIVSANQNTEAVAKEAGAEGFLAKPFDINRLTAIVDQYLS